MTAAPETELRFQFGENWKLFLELVDDDRIQAAEESIRSYLGVDRIDGMTFLDIGSGSGLFSLAARNLGATVTSFDFDPQSVACTAELRRRYYPNDAAWTVMRGSALDEEFVATLGRFDIVYSWGVLHHTGDMLRAFGIAADLAVSGGRLFISIYNDQGRKSRMWGRVKRAYNEGGSGLQRAILTASRAHFWWEETKANTILRLRGVKADRSIVRGMDKERDLLDWVGGYPFEVATPEQVFDFFRRRGFTLDRLKTCGGALGCNEFVFTRTS